ncbi:plastocyanin/azurin family copper-binding protein [Sunxiuqinia indica]|uniref:plastocyanin/azurin family copper-binding protein n=1 Tax=Sunxiuqinia indica TaxID=2692584 RepID=UPI001357D983|nr:plastocyanin/azurin family copper-binding protein [Sunxiuqinia indica]
MKTLFTSEKYLRNALTLFFLLLTVGIYAQTRHDIEVTSNVFTPSSLTIDAGDTVVWTNTQGSHNVNGKQSSYPSNPESFGNNVGTGWTYSHVFTIAGNYDYQCDPHLALGMTGKIIVEEIQQPTNKLTVNFTGMTPHVGQELKLAVVNQTTGSELARTSETVSESFSVEILGIENGESYFVDFFSDHSGNGMYDAPSSDHAWRMELNDVDGDETLDFAHNTNFTDIMWMNKLTVNFTGMTPHVGQTLKLALIDQATGMEKARTSVTVEESFEIHVMGIEDGKSYFVDFFSDHSGNGVYDAPPTDHAWRMELNDVDGDETLDFAHNTNFTDIMWMNKLTLNFTGMTPHAGQMLTLYLLDVEAGTYIDTIEVTDIPVEFSLSSYKIEVGKSYELDFFADHNGNGEYNSPPTDHAWRMELNDVQGDSTVVFSHNTNFTDISIATSTDDLIYKDNDLVVYPNPSSEYVYLTSNRFKIDEGNISLYNSLGTKIQASQVGMQSNRIGYHVQHLKPGLYLFKVETESATLVRKFIKK